MEMIDNKGVCVALMSVLLWAPGCDEAEVSPEEQFTEAEDRSWSCNNSYLVDDVRDLIEERGITPFERPAPIRAELVELGRALFHDKILSGGRDTSCGTCHNPALGTTDRRPLNAGVLGHGVGLDRVGGQVGGRHSQGLYNLHTLETLAVDGKVEQVEDMVIGLGLPVILPEYQEAFEDFPGVAKPRVVAGQAMLPQVTFGEMLGVPGTDPNNELMACVDPNTPLPLVFACVFDLYMVRIGQIPEYVEMFEDAYNMPFEDLNFGHVGTAIAAYELMAFSFNESPWDAFVEGDDCALNGWELRGARQFLDEDRANCASCHSGNGFTDNEFHNTLAPTFGCGNDLPKRNGPDGLDDFGRTRNTYAEPWVFGGYGDEIFPVEDRYKWRTPPLRNVEFTAPYGRLGQTAELWDFVAHYNDPEAELLSYDITQLPDTDFDDYTGFACEAPSLHASMVDNASEIIAAGADPLLDEVTLYSWWHVSQLTSFLYALSDEDAHPDNLEASIPDSVPSNLPVDRP